MTNIAVGPLGFRAAVDVNPKGERNRFYLAENACRADSTSTLDENNPEPSRIVPRESGAQGPPVPGTSHSVAIRDIEVGDVPTGECWGSSPTRPIFIQIPVRLLIRRKRQPYNTRG